MVSNLYHKKIHEYIGVQAVPDMYYGQNRLYIACIEHNILLQFSPIDSLLCCRYEEQNARICRDFDAPAPVIMTDQSSNQSGNESMEDHGSFQDFNDLPDEIKKLNSIDVIPNPIKAHETDDWQH